jgi:hypothetical protein
MCRSLSAGGDEFVVFFTNVRRLRGRRAQAPPFVFELRDLWPESIKAVGASDAAMPAGLHGVARSGPMS